MSQHFKLTGQEFYDNNDLFNVLEIKAEQIVGKDYQALSKFLKKQYNKLILVNHPDKGGDKNRFDQIYKAYQELKKYIEPLESGNPCVKVSVGAESNGRLTEREFHYRKKLFDTLGIGEEAIGKDFDELTSILKKNDRSFEEDFKYCFSRDALSNLSRSLNPGELDKRLSKPSMRLFLYIFPLKEKKDLVDEDKKELALRFIERKNALLLIRALSVLPLSLLTTVTIGCYFSWWIIAFNIAISRAFGLLVNYYMEKYKNSEISTDEFISKMNYIALGSKLLINYPLAAFSVYLLTTNFIANRLTIGGGILGSLLTLAILIEVLASVFSKGCEIYAEKHAKDLLEEDPRDRVQKETDLLGRYDPRKLLMPIIMPLVRKCFAEVANEFAERNFDEVNTNMSDVNAKQPSGPQKQILAQ
ncbi:MAG: molecular chaperone DnaJ [Wolbachia endosymbiont of Nomada fabriciana]|uniref:molecular chaperone DnaJ n=1 Tax=unclassified Wolbachia TaxID=2640676 RepID=UPI00221FFDD4|nr:MULTISPECIES: molecular chaperone DnaJ [unclassified Wolbachia]MDX5497096.1 molecular chaperone DnaJ [Wolbachia endosymbiont of Nomada fabriciana]MDX5507056.1 molecular chaperone DnaJ [Wolbachia endosymbiont of Hylaeus sinuatus]MDX5528480.1 molecular chaperone DnaJ [Wolbachia endosymbiont of Andrena minutula]